MKNSERIFYFFDVEVVSGVAGVRLPLMDELAVVWKRYVDAGNAQMSIRKEKAFLVIGGIDVDLVNNTVSLLVRLSDSQAPNAVTSNIQRGTFTEHVKGADDGNDVGAHIIISTLQERTKPNVYCAVVEGMRGLSYREIRQVLNKVIHRQYSDDPAVFTVDDPRGGRDREGNFKRIPHLPRIEMRGHPSETLIADVQRGRLSGVVLVKEERNTPVGQAGYLKKQKTELRLSIDHQHLPQAVWAGVTSSIATMGREYPHARISFKMLNQRAVTIEIDSITGQPVDELYIRTVRLTGINPLLAASSKTIVAHLLALAKPHLIAHRDI